LVTVAYLSIYRALVYICLSNFSENTFTQVFYHNTFIEKVWLYVILANVNFAICYRRSVCLSVTFVRPTQPVEIVGNFSSPFGTLPIH